MSGSGTGSDEVPPEAFLDGPPDGDRPLRRALRTIRAAQAAERRRRLVGLTVTATVAAVLVLGAGVAIGRATAPPPTVLEEAAGGRVLTGRSGPVTMTATLTPAAGWVRVAATVGGVEPGTRCRLVVVDRSGRREIAGSWVVPPGGKAGTTLDGSAAVAPGDVAAVLVEDGAGRRLVELTA